MHALEDVLGALDRHQQRATYGAVAGVVGSGAQSVMSKRARTQLNSWVVNARSKLPTGYSDAEVHAELRRRAHVISTSAELSAWLQSRAGALPGRVSRTCLIGDDGGFFDGLDWDVALHLLEVKAYQSGVVALRCEVRRSTR